MDTEGAVVGGRRRTPAIVAACCLLLIAIAWIGPLSRSLWSDELGTFWVIQDDVPTVLDRATAVQGQTPAYYVGLWSLTRVAGDSEVVLRLPSLIAMAGAAFLMHRLAAGTMGRGAGWVAAGILAAASPAASAAANARPYGLATLLAVASSLALVRWIARPGSFTGSIYALTAALMIHAHHLYGLIALAHAIYLLDALTRERVTRRDVVLVWIGLVILLSPAIPQVVTLWGRRGELSVQAGTLPPWVTGVVLPVALAAALGAMRRFTASSAERITSERIDLLATCMLVIPPAALGLVTTFTTASIPPTRYVVIAVPGLALLMASTLQAAAGGAVRTFAAGMIIAILAVQSIASTLPVDEDWRGAIASARRARAPVLLQAGFVEARDLSRLPNAEDDFIMSPLSYYPIDADAYALPFVASPRTLSYVRRLVTRRLDRPPRLVSVVREKPFGYTRWLTAAIEPVGYRIESSRAFGSITVTTFAVGIR